MEAQHLDTAEGHRVGYVNNRSIITVALYRNYPTILKTLDQDGNRLLERYLDTHGKPAVIASGHSTLKREYDADGNWFSQTYPDDKPNPFTIRSG